MEDVLRIDGHFAIVTGTERTSEPPRVLKQGDTFGVFNQHGDIDVGGEQGLFHAGTRFLSRFELLLAGRRPLLLSSTISNDNAVFVVDLTNPDILIDGVVQVARGALHVMRSRVIEEGSTVERIRVANHGLRTLELSLSFRFDADFADLFEVRGISRSRRGTRYPTVLGRESVLRYVGLDHVERRTVLSWSRTPDTLEGETATFLVRLEPRGTTTIETAVWCESDGRGSRPVDHDQALAVSRRRLAERADHVCRIHTSNQSFNRWVNRSRADLDMMITSTPHGPYPYAGIPWFSAPFGRDGLITAFELLWADPGVAHGVLTFLAATQATSHSDVQEAQPGKILHEMRSGEMPTLGEVPFGRYYGSIDATPLFVMLARAYYERTGDAALVDRLWPHLLAALDWMAHDGDPDGDGFLEYARISPAGLIQQGWKDSHDSIFHADGALAEPPIALAEVQGYAYAAWRGAARLAQMRGDAASAQQWHSRADSLRSRFEEAFWCEDLGTYALALDKHKRPCRVRTSNPGHCLFSGIVSSKERAGRVAETLLAEASFAGWGIRTVASGEMRYNPMSYHNGSIWPHDNAVAAAGLARYGFTHTSTRLLEAMFDLSQAVDLYRMPELICGFHRRAAEQPTLYPVACAPQSWAAGAVYLLIQSCLGLRIEATPERLTFVRTVLPESIDWLRLSNLKIGRARVDLLLERHPHDVGLTVLRREGELEIVSVK
jgi:glycogen debranching enzyme